MPRTERQIEMARRAAAAADRRAQERAERGMPRVRQEREQADTARQMQFAMTLLNAEPGTIYDMLKPREKWREHIDGRHQHHGREVYLQALHNPDRKPDPNYNICMLRGDRFLRNTFGRNLTVNDYRQLHRLVAPVEDGDFGLQPRTGTLDISFLQFNDSIDDLVEDEQPYVQRYSGTTVTLRSISEPLAEVDRLLEDYYDKVFVMLEDIARLHQALENLHPYVDYNTRTNRLVLNRLLAERREALCILHSPLDVHHSTLAHWVEAIERGQREWTAIVLEQRPGRGPSWEQFAVDDNLFTRNSLTYREEDFANLLARFT